MRDSVVDVMRGLTIVLVVVGHAIQKNVVDFASDPLKNSISTFHMPLFVLLSGFVVYQSLYERYHTRWLSKRFARLMLPFFSFGVIFFFGSLLSCANMANFFDWGLTKYLTFMFYNGGNSTTWFLWVLLLCSIGALIVRFLTARLNIKFILAVLIVILLVSFIPSKGVVLNLGGFQWYFVFFMLGFCIARYHEVTDKYRRVAFFYGAMFIVCLFLLDWAVGWLRIAPFNPTIQGMIYEGVDLRWFALRYLVVVLGAAFIYTIAVILNNVPFLRRVFCWLGAASIGIYLIHELFSGMAFGGGFLSVTSASIISLCLSIILIVLIRKSRHTKHILFGES